MIRRNFLKTSALAGLTTTLFGIGNKADAAPQPKRSLRIAHVTDTHIEPNGPSASGVASAFQKINSLKDKPDLILGGGDIIFDALARDKGDVKAQWQLWNKVDKENNSVPIFHCLGNHDVYGWGLKNNSAVSQDKLYGKDWAIDELKIPGRFYSFDKSNWHFIVLDSIHSSIEKSYLIKLDEEQYEWLTEDLKKTPSSTPVCILSHVPILSFCYSISSGTFLNNGKLDLQNWGLTHVDAIRIKDLFNHHPNVKLCLSGHLHMQELVEYLGVKYLNNGAVSGNWWKGKRFEFSPSFTIIDLYTDGSSTHYWMEY